jgi:lipopolysaccharide/colanic/teichoic acid biosynthesis glycosyltransferase
MLKRAFDICAAAIGLILLIPFLVLIAIAILIDSRGGVFYKQKRVGLHNKDFSILKFRTMRPEADKHGLLTVGGRDPRVTRIGYFLRKYKLDEFPQLINVIIGDMSIVGPRPEVRKYVNLYTEQQKKVLNIRPGITDYASIEFANENELLKQAIDPEQAYIHQIMPAKLELNLKYVQEKNLITDLKIIALTIAKILK